LKRLSFISICLVIVSIASGSVVIGQRYPLGIMPSGIVKVENGYGTYYVTLVKGDSELIVFDSSFKPVTIMDAVKNDGVNDIIYRDGKLYCFGFFSGRLVIIDASGYPGRWKKIDEIPTSSRLITGAFIDGRLGILSNESEFIVLETINRTILKRYKLPVTALTIAEDSSHFYVSLFYNYNTLDRSMETQKGLMVFDIDGQLSASLDIGKRPSYISIDGERLFLISYMEESLKVIDKATLKVIKTIELGRYPNYPVIQNGKLWISITGEDRVASIDLESYEATYYDLLGKGPIKTVPHGGMIYVLETITGTLEILDETGRFVETVKLEGYPVDIVFSGRDAAVLLQEDWKTGKNTGAMLTMRLN
jgi:YVTN family beta-propeller protein